MSPRPSSRQPLVVVEVAAYISANTDPRQPWCRVPGDRLQPVPAAVRQPVLLAVQPRQWFDDRRLTRGNLSRPRPARELPDELIGVGILDADCHRVNLSSLNS